MKFLLFLLPLIGLRGEGRGADRVISECLTETVTTVKRARVSEEGKHTGIWSRAYKALRTPSAKALRQPSVRNVGVIQRIPTR